MVFCNWCQLESDSDDKCCWCKRPFAAISSGSTRNDLYYLGDDEPAADKTPLIAAGLGLAFLAFVGCAFALYGPGSSKANGTPGVEQNLSGSRGPGISDVYENRFQATGIAAVPPNPVTTAPPPPPQRVAAQTPASSVPASPPSQPVAQIRGTPHFAEDLKGYVANGAYIESANVNLVPGTGGTDCFGTLTIINPSGQAGELKLWLNVDGAQYRLQPYEGAKENPQIRALAVDAGRSGNFSVIGKGIASPPQGAKISLVLETFDARAKLIGTDTLPIK